MAQTLANADAILKTEFYYYGTTGTGTGTYSAQPAWHLEYDPTRDSVQVWINNQPGPLISAQAIVQFTGSVFMLPVARLGGGYDSLSIPIDRLRLALGNRSVPEIKPKKPKKLKPAEEAQRLWELL